MHPEKQQGRFFGAVAFILAILFTAVAFLDGEYHWRVAWIAAVSGWWLLGLFCVVLGNERAKR